MAVRTAYDPAPGEVLTASNLEKLAGGWVGSLVQTADQVVSAPPAIVTSLNLTWTAVANRKYVCVVQLNLLQSAASDTWTVQLVEGGVTVLQEVFANRTADSQTATLIYTNMASISGSKTWAPNISRGSGTGNMTVGAATTRPNLITVSDVGSLL